MKQVFEYYFIERYALVDILNLDSEKKQMRVIINTYPKDWLEHYLKKQYYLYDPIFSNSGKVLLPFSWGKRTFERLSSSQEQIFNEASKYGIKYGTTIPLLPRPDGQCFLNILDHVNIHPYITYALTLATQFYYDRRSMLDSWKYINGLTHREKEILSMKSQGLSIKIIADKLSIANSTVVFHLRNIRQKLNTTSLGQALFLFGLSRTYMTTMYTETVRQDINFLVEDNSSSFGEEYPQNTFKLQTEPIPVFQNPKN